MDLLDKVVNQIRQDMRDYDEGMGDLNPLYGMLEQLSEEQLIGYLPEEDVE